MNARPPTTSTVDPGLIRPTWSRTWAGVAIASFVLCILALAFAGLVAFTSAFSTLPTYDAAATGTVTGGTHEDQGCVPAYDFMARGVSHQGTSPNVDEAYCDFAVGDSIDITYDPTDPDALSAPAEHYTSNDGLVVASLVVAGILLVVSVTSLVVAVRRKR